MDKQIRNRGFSKAVLKKIEEEQPELAKKFSENEINKIMDTALKVIAELLREGYRVIFEGYFSYFTKPVKRKCSNLHTNETWWTYKRRIRTKPMDYIKTIAEVDMTEEEYEKHMESVKK